MKLLATSIKTLLALSMLWSPSIHAENLWVQVRNGNWVPEPSVLAELKAGIESYSTSTALKQQRKLRNWADYTFQYQALEERGSKFILVNALCHKDPRWNLEQDLVLVLDGGSCFFNLKYDPVRRRFHELRINGEA